MLVKGRLGVTMGDFVYLSSFFKYSRESPIGYRLCRVGLVAFYLPLWSLDWKHDGMAALATRVDTDTGLFASVGIAIAHNQEAAQIKGFIFDIK